MAQRQVFHVLPQDQGKWRGGAGRAARGGRNFRGQRASGTASLEPREGCRCRADHRPRARRPHSIRVHVRERSARAKGIAWEAPTGYVPPWHPDESHRRNAWPPECSTSSRPSIHCVKSASSRSVTAPAARAGHEPDGHRRYSMTWSARWRSEGAIVRPRALAVLRLMTNSNLVGRSIGMSAGLAPANTRATYCPQW